MYSPEPGQAPEPSPYPPVDPWAPTRPVYRRPKRRRPRGKRYMPSIKLPFDLPRIRLPRLRLGCLVLLGLVGLVGLVTTLYLLFPVKHNILLLGLDYTDPWNAVGRTDTIILATVKPVLSDQDAGRLVAGIELEDGWARFVEITKLEQTADRARALVTVAEGRNRLIRRCFESLGYKVHRLKRQSIGGLSLGKLSPEQTRELTGREISALRQLVGLPAR